MVSQRYAFGDIDTERRTPPLDPLLMERRGLLGVTLRKTERLLTNATMLAEAAQQRGDLQMLSALMATGQVMLRDAQVFYGDEDGDE